MTDLSLLPRGFGDGVPTEAYTTMVGPVPIQAGSPSSTHSFGDQQSGLQIEFRTNDVHQGMCSWGLTGHTSTYNYIVTAGHCAGLTYDDFAGQATHMEIWQNGSSDRILAISPYIYTMNTSTLDLGRMSSSYADTNCYHGNHLLSDPHCRWPIAQRALHNSWELNSDQTCASLTNSDTYRCGYIEDVNQWTNKVRAGITAIPGDSGSGMKWDYRADGILTDVSTNDLFFHTAYHVENYLGAGYFYLNCASGEANKLPSQWGVCPAVDA